MAIAVISHRKKGYIMGDIIRTDEVGITLQDVVSYDINSGGVKPFDLLGTTTIVVPHSAIDFLIADKDHMLLRLYNEHRAKSGKQEQRVQPTEEKIAPKTAINIIKSKHGLPDTVNEEWILKLSQLTVKPDIIKKYEGKDINEFVTSLETEYPDQYVLIESYAKVIKKNTKTGVKYL